MTSDLPPTVPLPAVQSTDLFGGDYCVRVWLNNDGHSSTSSVVAFDGLAKWSMGPEDKPCHASFLEISDCHGKVRLHCSRFESRAEFASKIRLLARIVGEFADHLGMPNA